MSFTQIALERRDDVNILRLDSGKVNPITPGLIAEVDQALVDSREDREIGAVVLTGTGRFFSFGLDVAYLLELNRDEMTSFLKSLNAMIRRLALFPKPLVGAINGHAMAGGLLMALTADYRVGATGAFSIGLSEVKLGIAAPAASIRMASRKLGHALVYRLCVTGAVVRPEEALAEGMWDLLAEPGDLIDCAVGKASEYARETGAGIGLNKRFLHRGVFDLPPEALKAEDETWLDAWFSYEAQDRLRALVTRS